MKQPHGFNWCKPGEVLLSEVFSKLNYEFFGYLDLVTIFLLIIDLNSCQGDLSNVSAKTATLVLPPSSKSQSPTVSSRISASLLQNKIKYFLDTLIHKQHSQPLPHSQSFTVILSHSQSQPLIHKQQSQT